MIVVAVIGIVVAIAVPAFIRARENARGRGCQENLAKLEGAKMQYSLETKAPAGTTIPPEKLWPADASGYLRQEPKCPSNDLPYIINPLGTDPTCPNFDPNSEFVPHKVTGTI